MILCFFLPVKWDRTTDPYSDDRLGPEILGENINARTLEMDPGQT